MKAIVRYLVLMLLVCGTALAWKSTDRRFSRFSPADDGARQKEEGEAMQAALQPLLQSRGGSRASATWSRNDFQARLEEAFQKNDPCLVQELIHHPQDASPREFWSAGMAVLLGQYGDRNSQLEELLAGADSPLYGIPREGSRKLEDRFFNALIYSGQLQGLDESDDQPRRTGKNFEKAIEVFKELAQEDAENGAHSFFLAAALRQTGAKKEEVRAAMSQAARVPKFEVYYQGIFDRLLTVGYSNVATFTWVHAFLEKMPAPDYDQSIRYLKYWASEEEPGKWIAHKLAKRLADMGAKFKAQSPGYLFSRQEYITAKNLQFTVEGKPQKSWEEYINKTREAFEFISERPRPVIDAEISLYGDRIGDKKACGPEAWKSLYAAYKEKKAN